MYTSRSYPFLAVLSLAACAAAAVGGPVHVTGLLFEEGRLDNGEQAYTNRDYVWEEVPEPLRGWQFTRLNGGVRSTVRAQTSAAGMLYIAGRPSGGREFSGWKLLQDWSFHYTDTNRTRVWVFAKYHAAGERVEILQSGWTGCMLIAPALDCRPAEPEPDHSAVPGVVIDHSPKYSQSYIGCPSIAILPDGAYVASHSFFGPGPQRGTTSVFGSRDRGEHWHHLTDMAHQTFSCLFVHGGKLHIMGTGGRGIVAIRRSDDGGKTWTEPKDRNTGILLDDATYHSAPVPVLRHGGRVWRAMEDRGAGRGWPREFRAFVMSAPDDADLLWADSWHSTDRLPSSDTWLDRQFEGWLEGNAVATPEGDVVNILRAHSWIGGIAAVTRVSHDGTKLEFDAATGFVGFPGGATKFTIRFDPVSALYWSLTNAVDEETRCARPASSVRNTLALVSSPNLEQWTAHRRVLHHPDPGFHAFQYVDWQFDGRDIVAVSRTAFDDGLGGAHNYHDANYFTFHRVREFRAERPVPNRQP